MVECTAFPERRIRSDWRRDRASFSSELRAWTAAVFDSNPLLCRRVSALLNMPSPILLPAQKRQLEDLAHFRCN
jgi:hypothetical protein